MEIVQVTKDEAVELVTAASWAKQVWIDHLLRHDLAALTDEGRVHCYDVRRPAEVSS